MPPDLFIGPKLKVKRGEHHISDLEARIQTFLDAGKHRIVAEIEAKTRQEITRVKEDEPLPEMWALIVGDVVHNLRSALDILACDLVHLQGKSTADVHFPFGVNQETFENVIQTKNIRKAGDQALAMLRKFKPYRGGNNLLRGLHDLNIADKHKLILTVSTIGHIHYLPTSGGGSITNVTFAGAKNLVATPANMPNRKTRRATGWVPQEKQVNASIKIVFGETEAFPGEEIEPTLRAISAEVTDVIQAFETLTP